MEKLTLPNQFLEIAEESLREGKSVNILADGKSMFPFIRGGKDVSEIIPLSAEEPLKLWHGYMFRHNGSYVIHRLVGREGDKYAMLGDGNLKIKEIVAREDVIGILSKIIKPSGKSVNCLSSGWLLRGRIWYALRLFRRYLLAIARRLYK